MMKCVVALTMLSLLAGCDGETSARAARPTPVVRPVVPELASRCLQSYRDLAGPIVNCSAAIAAGGFSAGLLALVYNTRGEGYCDARRFDQGIADQNQAIALAPNFPQAYADRANCRLKEGEALATPIDFAATIGAALQGRDASKRPAVPEVVSNCLRANRSMEEPIDAGPAAITACAAAITAGGLSDEFLALAYNARGDGYCAVGKYDLAIADQTRAIAIAPNFPNAFADRAPCHLGLNQSKAAVADYDAAISLAPKVPGYFILRGKAHNWSGEHDLALADYAEARRMAPHSNEALDGTGRTLFGLGRFAEAADVLAEVLRETPGDRRLTLWLHIARARAHQPDAAEFAANTKALDLTPWPGPLFGLFLGKMTYDEALTASVRYPDDRYQSECDTAVFSAQQRLIAGDTAAARNRLSEATSVCPYPETGFLLSWADLKRIDPRMRTLGPW